jgi:hypothetical protein
MSRGQWTVPLLVDGRASRLDGDLAGRVSVGCGVIAAVACGVVLGTMIRFADIIALAAGLGAAALGGLVYVEHGGVTPADSTLGMPVAGARVQR